ncbi:uncharacterized protein DS421_19g665440 [Arachis hypogaea]|uniref:Uncharacterized protein n=1 Tax=Arachis hypogaea TaxID=3818 RepID=A0A6B9VE09_ARAHY|nr:uncharacterized protein DS421_19g665440 [Arachis hypogaea]
MARQVTSEAETWLTRSNKVTVMAAPAVIPAATPQAQRTGVAELSHGEVEQLNGDEAQPFERQWRGTQPFLFKLDEAAAGVASTAAPKRGGDTAEAPSSTDSCAALPSSLNGVDGVLLSPRQGQRRWRGGLDGDGDGMVAAKPSTPARPSSSPPPLLCGPFPYFALLPPFFLSFIFLMYLLKGKKGCGCVARG